MTPSETAQAQCRDGFAHFAARRYAEAAIAFRASDEAGPNPIARFSLGHALYMLREFAGAAAAFEAGAAMMPPDQHIRRRHARARTFQAMIEGRVTEALAEYPALAGDAAEDPALIEWDAFFVLGECGARAAAAEIGRLRLARDPGDPIQRHLLDAVEGRDKPIAPPEYVEAYFDRFAVGFDAALVDGLQYHVPRDMPALLPPHLPPGRACFADMLDLGCGTGLAAPHLAAIGAKLTGVDLSANMLEQACKRGLYAELAKADVVEHLRAHPNGFDLVFAADLLIYIGDVGPLFAALARAVRPDGLFAASIETLADDRDYALLGSGRFAQSPAYLRRLAAPAFAVLEEVETTIRLEVGKPIPGRMMVLRRR